MIQQLELLEKNAAKLSLDEQRSSNKACRNYAWPTLVPPANGRNALGEDEANAESTDTPGCRIQGILRPLP